MELICPACEARYQAPDGSIGEKGRQVSCMNCGKSWHAYPPLVLGTPDTSAASPSTGMQWTGPGAQGVSSNQPPLSPTPVQAPAAPDVQAVPLTSGAVDRAPDGSRSEQLAEIRQMLAEVQSENHAASVEPVDDGRTVVGPALSAAAVAASASPAPEPATSSPSPAAFQDDGEDPGDALRKRLEQRHGNKTQAAETNMRKVRRKHERKARKRATGKSAGTGAFLTGFLLISIIASVMIAMYLLHPQIIEKMPGTESALLEYVATIDSLRVSVAETYAGARSWLTAQLG